MISIESEAKMQNMLFRYPHLFHFSSFHLISRTSYDNQNGKTSKINKRTGRDIAKIENNDKESVFVLLALKYVCYLCKFGFLIDSFPSFKKKKKEKRK